MKHSRSALGPAIFLIPFFYVCSLPVDLSAAFAAKKSIVLFINVQGHKVPYVLFGDRQEERVADRAARERSGH